MVLKFAAGEGMDTITNENGAVFDRYFSLVTEDAFDRYSGFIYLIIKRVDDADSALIRRNAYLVPFPRLDEFLGLKNTESEKIVHIEPLTTDMVAFTREELRKDHVPASE